MRQPLPLYTRDVERLIVTAHLRGSRVLWVVAPHTCTFDVERVAERGSDGDASELGCHYGVWRAVTTRVVAPRGHQTGRFALSECRLLIDSPTEEVRWRFPQSDADWAKIYLIVKTLVLDAASQYREPRRCKRRRRTRSRES